MANWPDERKKADYLMILRGIQDAGGSMHWSDLHSRGHHIMQVRALVKRDLLQESRWYHFTLTDAGRQALQNTPTTGEE